MKNDIKLLVNLKIFLITGWVLKEYYCKNGITNIGSFNESAFPNRDPWTSVLVRSIKDAVPMLQLIRDTFQMHCRYWSFLFLWECGHYDSPFSPFSPLPSWHLLFPSSVVSIFARRSRWFAFCETLEDVSTSSLSFLGDRSEGKRGGRRGGMEKFPKIWMHTGRDWVESTNISRMGRDGIESPQNDWADCIKSRGFNTTCARKKGKKGKR